jgi:hypothetical protein
MTKRSIAVVAVLTLLILVGAAMTPARYQPKLAPDIWQIVPVPSGVGSNPLETRYLDYNSSTGYLAYVGVAISNPTLATSQAVWAIESITYSGNNITQVQWATCAMACVWDNRASLTYK